MVVGLSHDQRTPEGRVVIVLMGPSGAGKTTIGRRLADALGWPLRDGDDYHPPENVARMRAGVPLTDADRAPWLAALAALVADAVAADRPLLLACSALKRAYREALVPPGPESAVRFVYLRASPALLAERLAARRGHFFGPRLLDSQLAALEEPGGDEAAPVLTFDASADPDALVAEIRGALRV
jgi:gluconokinase